MLSSDFTAVLTKPVQIPQSGFGNVSLYILVVNSTPEEARVVTFFIEVGSVQSPHRSLPVDAEGSKLTVIPMECPPGEHILTVYAKADKDDRVSLSSVAASIR